MKSKIIFGINLVWASFTAFVFPFCFAWIYLDITGHSKGYDYDLGPEKDVSQMLGAVELIIWALLVLPSTFYVFRKAIQKGKFYILLLSAFFIILAIVFILFIWGGFYPYLHEVFNI